MFQPSPVCGKAGADGPAARTAPPPQALAASQAPDILPARGGVRWGPARSLGKGPAWAGRAASGMVWGCRGTRYREAPLPSRVSPGDKKGPHGRDSHWDSHWDSPRAKTGAVEPPAPGQEGERGQESLCQATRRRRQWPMWPMASWHPAWAGDTPRVPWAGCCTYPEATCRGHGQLCPQRWGRVRAWGRAALQRR